MKKLLILVLLLLFTPSAFAVVQISSKGKPAAQIGDVYNLDGIPYIALDDVLEYLEIEGHWDSVAHIYHIPTPGGDAVFFPGGRYIRRGERFIPLKYPARFVDGRLRVPEDFLTRHLPNLLGERIAYRNLNPPSARTARKQGAMDRLFSFLLRRKTTASGGQLRAVAIDPGHGGEDVGVLAPNAVKEKDINFALATRLEKLLKMQLGIPVYLSRDGDYGLTPEQRLEPAMKEDVDAFLLIHSQGSFSPRHRGINLLIRPQEAEVDLAENSSEGDGATKEVVPALPLAKNNESLRLAKTLRSSLKRSGFNVGEIQESVLFPLGRGDLLRSLLRSDT
jgi:N-acetylmuramoyl-L-alanine amidase